MEVTEDDVDRYHMQFSVYIGGTASTTTGSTIVSAEPRKCSELHGPYQDGETVKFNMTLENKADRIINLKMRLFEVGLLDHPQHFIVEVNGKTIFKNASINIRHDSPGHWPRACQSLQHCTWLRAVGVK